LIPGSTLQGKFYELYEKDAEIGHNEFDLKLTDRVKMKMVRRDSLERPLEISDMKVLAGRCARAIF
jgi:hypothetical protein